MKRTNLDTWIETIEEIPNLTRKDLEELQLRSYALAKKHDLFSDSSDESIASFADEIAELLAQAREGATDSFITTEEDVSEEAEVSDRAVSDTDGKEDDSCESV